MVRQKIEGEEHGAWSMEHGAGSRESDVRLQSSEESRGHGAKGKTSYQGADVRGQQS